MKKDIIKNGKYKSVLILFLICTVILFLMFIPYIIYNVPMVYGTDLKPQWFFFYTEFKKLMFNFINNKTLPFYSWSLFLGNNFYASKSYYMMGDIFAYIGLIFKNLNFFDLNLILEIIKFYVSAFSMYFLLQSFNYKNKTKIIGSLAYAFSGWAIFFSGQMVFLSFYSLMPLYFLGVEEYLKHNKKILFIILTAILLFISYYFFFTISLLTVIYFIYRYYVINKSLKDIFKNALILISYYFVGASITGVLIYPSFMYITSSDRLKDSFSLISMHPIKSYFNLVYSTFIPNYLYIYRQNIFETGNHVTREICLYSSGLTALLLPHFIKDKDEVYKKATIILYSVLFVMMLIPVFSFILHGFSDPSFRWLMFVIFMNIIVSCKVLDNIESIDDAFLKITLAFISVLLITIIFVTGILTNQLSDILSGSFNIQLFITFIFVIIYVIYYFLLINKKINLLLILLTIELGISGFTIFYTSMDKSEDGSYEFIYKVTHVLQDEEEGLNNFLNNIEPINCYEYYRVYIPHESLYWSYSHNLSVMYNLNGVMTYDSSYSPSINTLKDKVYEIRDFDSEWIFNIKNDYLLDFLNVKYAIVTNENELPKNGNYRLMTDNYRGFLVYRNDDYRPLGTTFNNVDYIENFDVKRINNIIYVNDDYYEELANINGNNNSFIENIVYKGNMLSGYVYSDTDSLMVVSLPYDQGWNIFVNGEKVKVYDVNGGFMSFKVFKGDNNIEMYFTPYGFKTGAIISFIGVILLLLIIVKEKKHK